MRIQRVKALVEGIEIELKALDVSADTPAYDGWLAPAQLASALADISTGGRLLVRACSETVVEEGSAEAGPIHAEPVWLVLEKGSASLSWCSLRAAAAGDGAAGGGASAGEAQAQAVELSCVTQLCCDAKKCSANKALARLTLRHDSGCWLLAEWLEPDEAAARAALTPLLRELSGALGLPNDSVDSGGVANAPTEPLREVLSAAELGRFALRREGEMMVLRDFASIGPREASPREHAILAALVVGALGSWYGALVNYQHQSQLSQQQQSYELVAVFAAVAAVLSTAAFAAWNVARHSAAYRARNEPLLYLHRDSLVIAPWLLRNGAVRSQPDGRYGAALPLKEVTELAVEQLPDGDWVIACTTEHGPFHIGSRLSEAQARLWCTRLQQQIRAHQHSPANGKARRPKAAVLSAALLVMLALLVSACDGARPRQPVAPPAATSAAVSATPLASSSAHASASATPSSSAGVVKPVPVAKLSIVEDDIAAAKAKAAASDKVVFVEVWAPWCHTCLSMQSFVLPDPAIVALQDRVVFAAIDSDKPVNEAFMDRYAVNVWPTMFMIEPGKDGEVLGLWHGAASVNELRAFMLDALDVRNAKLEPSGPLSALIAGRRAQAKGKHAAAARAYQRALSAAKPDWPRRGEATVGLIRSHYRNGHWGKCARLGRDSIESIEGAAMPTDVSWVLRNCAGRLADKTAAKALLLSVEKRMARHVTEPPKGSSVDDRVDALGLYAKLLSKRGDKVGTQKARLSQLALLEKAAAAAPSPETAATFDYARMNAYLAVGRGDDAIALFSQRMKQLPDGYEAAGRLAETYIALGRFKEAAAPIEHAIEKSYGPRRIRYLTMRANIRRGLTDKAGEGSALEAAIAAYGKLSAKQRKHPRNRDGLNRLKQRLAKLRAGR